jgi:hypothetical protein
MELADAVRYGLAALAAIAVIALCLVLVRRRLFFRGYEDYAQDIRDLRDFLRGKLRRDAGEIVLRSRFHRKPIEVRLSNRMDTPGCLITITGRNRLWFTTAATQNASLGTSRPISGTRHFVYERESVVARKFLLSRGEEILARMLISREWAVRVERERTLLAMQIIPTQLFQVCRTQIPLLSSLAQAVEQPKFVVPQWIKVAVAIAIFVAGIVALWYWAG